MSLTMFSRVTAADHRRRRISWTGHTKLICQAVGSQSVGVSGVDDSNRHRGRAGAIDDKRIEVQPQLTDVGVGFADSDGAFADLTALGLYIGGVLG